MQLGTFTFADVKLSGGNAYERTQDLLREIELAEEAGLDLFGVGEHHRPDFAVSSPATVLAAAAVRTKRIRLTSAVTVLSSDDPVRVFQQFATVDLLSGGRAEIMAGRGSFIESFPLFGYQLDEYDDLFEERLELLIALNEKEIVNWQGRKRASIRNLGVYPRPLQQKLPIWVAVGGTPESVLRAAKFGLPMGIAIIGGFPDRFLPFVELYRKTAAEAGHIDLPLGINTQGYIAPTSQQARDEFYPHYAEAMNRIGRERGWPPLTRAQFDALCGPKGYLLVGSPQEVTDKILYEHELFGHQRMMLQMDTGATPHEGLMRSIELFGTKVAPEVRKHVEQAVH